MNSCRLAIFLMMSFGALSVPVSGNMENKLIDYLKTIVNNARPLKNSSNILNMTFGLSFNSFLIEEHDLTLTAVAYETQAWPAEILMWDPESYNGIDKAVLAHEDLWTPDITLYNMATDTDLQYGQGNVLVRAQGYAVLIRTSKSKVKCEVDSLRFPYETLNCTQTYGSWIYDNTQLDLILADQKVDVSDLAPNPQWALTEASAERRETKYPCCPGLYPSIRYNLIFDRHSRHYVHVLIFPSFLLSVLTILLFLFPTSSQERITLGIILFCAFFGLLLYTSTLVVGWNQFPYFVRFLVFNLVVITLFTFLNAIIVKLSNSETGQEVPKFLRTIMFSIFGRIFCMRSIVQRNQSQYFAAPEFLIQPPGNYNKFSLTSEKPLLNPKEDTTDNLPEIDLNDQRGLEENVASIREVTTRYIQHQKDVERRRKCTRQWKDMATVLNMLFFIIYVTMAIISVCAVYIQVSIR